MKTNYIILTFAMLFVMINASAQQGINYKAIINDANGDAIANTTVTVQFTILENGITNVFQETHSPTTDANGIIIVNIGEGSAISGDFNSIDWGSKPHFLKTEINSGEGLTDLGTTEFKAVPYALHAETANMPKLPADQIAAIQNPSDGLVLFNTTTSKLNVYNEDGWNAISMSPYDPPPCLPLPTDADAGEDQSVNVVETTLQGNAPEFGTGTWSIIQGTEGTIDEPNNPNSRFFGTPQTYVLRWTISNECGETTDDVKIGIFDNAIFVWSDGSDANPGTYTNPKATIQAGISAALAQGKSEVVIAYGEYSSTVNLKSGINLLGGYDPVTWVFTDGTNNTRLSASNKTLTAEYIENVIVQGIDIESTGTPSVSSSSYAVYLANCNDITLRYCSISSSNGLPGSDGVTGRTGESGNRGNNGAPGCENSTGFCSTCSEPNPGGRANSSFGSYGGKGGIPGLGDSDGLSGERGGLADIPSGGSSGSGGTTDYSSYNCPDSNAKGGNGNNGSQGAFGVRGASFGGANSAGYIVANGANGTIGQHGAGGGGGGGGRGGGDLCNSYGSAGGGGGSGGEGGAGGIAGTGGGGSFGIWIYDGNRIEITNCDIITGNGGDGGYGGNGGIGGIGGLGGGTFYGGEEEQDDGGCGGKGGNGGEGGAGGHGGGGGGGPSIGIVQISSNSISLSTNNFNLGAGGSGGSSDGNSGINGISANTRSL